MTTAVVFPARRRARGRVFPAGARTTVVLALVVLAVGSLLAATDVGARAGIRTTDRALASSVHQLSGLEAKLGRAEAQRAAARAVTAASTRSFDAARSTLSGIQATLSADQAGVRRQGVDLGMLDACLGAVEEALDEIAVGRTTGGLAILQASSSTCAAVDETA